MGFTIGIGLSSTAAVMIGTGINYKTKVPNIFQRVVREKTVKNMKIEAITVSNNF